MRLTGTEDLRIQKTVTAIKESFEELICEKQYPEITVTELCARAMINKKTFYHYYPTLDDLLAEMQLELSEAYIELVKDYRLPEDAEKVNRIFFEYSAAQGMAIKNGPSSRYPFSGIGRWASGFIRPRAGGLCGRWSYRPGGSAR